MKLATIRFGDLGQLFDGPHATPTRQSQGPHFLNIASLVDGRLDLAQSDHVSSDDFVRWTKRVTPAEGDLLFSYETRLGDAALMPGGVKACLGRRMALLRPNRQVVDPRFLLYYYLSPVFRTIIDRYTIRGATVNRIGLSTMGSWPIAIPELKEQRAIADVLGALDEKFAANTKLVSTIEGLAGTMFRGLMSSSTKSSSLGSILTLEYGKSLPAGRRKDGAVAVFGSGGVVGSHDQALLPGPGVVVGRKGTAGAVHWAAGAFYPIDTTFFVVPSSEEYSMIFCYFVLQSLRLDEMNSDSAVPGLNRNEAHAAITRIPEIAAMRAFGSAATELFQEGSQLQRECESLAFTRDALLPLLMSGKIRVKDAEQMVGDVV